MSREDAEYVIGWYADPPDAAATVVDTVEQVTGHPPRTFTQWVTDHAPRFRSPTDAPTHPSPVR